jgi:nucleotide-binding universal stress UspA family protein
VDEQLGQIALYWISMHNGEPAPLTVHVVSRDRDVALDLGGGNRIPKMSERRAHSVAELREAGGGVRRVLMLHDGTTPCSDLLQAVLTALDPQVALALVPVPPPNETSTDHAQVQHDRQRARQLGRELPLQEVQGDVGAGVVRLAREGAYDLVVVPLPADLPARPRRPLDERSAYILQHAHCPVLLAGTPVVPNEVVGSSG